MLLAIWAISLAVSWELNYSFFFFFFKSTQLCYIVLTWEWNGGWREFLKIHPKHPKQTNLPKLNVLAVIPLFEPFNC